MVNECLICNSKIEYLQKDEEMKCIICHKTENTKSRCEKGHYICNSCHMEGINIIIDICAAQKSSNPFKIIEKLMSESFCHMHGPEIMFLWEQLFLQPTKMPVEKLIYRNH